MTQVDIFAPPSTLDAKFWEFHQENPQVFEKLVKMTTELKQAGRRKVGIKMLFEVIRWQHALETRGDHFKLNNSYTSRYARIIEEQHPELAGMFETRSIRS
jgi:hypothetical protein